MRHRTSLLTVVLGLATAGSLGTTNCADDIIRHLVDTVADHENRIDELSTAIARVSSRRSAARTARPT
jgi:hypothetical protein